MLRFLVMLMLCAGCEREARRFDEPAPFSSPAEPAAPNVELHPGQCCYNPRSLKRLREECGPEIGVNLDFSHLLWQRMDPILVIRELEGMIYHMHAKDISMDAELVRTA